MSTLEVKVVRIEILPHENSDFLEIAKIIATELVGIVKKGVYKTGDLCIFVPDGSVITNKMREQLEANSKIKIGSRVTCCKIRGQFSDGICLSPKEWLPENLIAEGNDVREFLGISKYEEPTHFQSSLKSKGVNWKYENPNFKRYTDIENWKRAPKLFDGREVIITKKLHGSNWRGGFVKKANLTNFERIQSWFGVKHFEYLVGSHNTIRVKGKHAEVVEDPWIETAERYDLERILRGGGKNETIIFAELIGEGIQRGYNFGLHGKEKEIRVFDIYRNGRYLDWDDVVEFCEVHHLPIVELVYRGMWSPELLKLADAVDEYNGEKYVREGIVIKPTKETRDHRGRHILKYVSEAFRLDKNNSEYH
jgi:RNA ligase (TIGR02306 family)